MTGKRSRWRQRVSIRSGTRRPRRGVSDVVATILLLALTITLFAAVFAFVTSFPSPPAQSNNQFQASLFYPTNGTTKYIAGVRIVHLAGPIVPGSALIYLKSANQPSLGVFQKAYNVSGGIGGASTWNLGQTWTVNFPATQLPLSGGNLTVYIVSQSQLLFSVILPGTSISPPPTIVSTSVSPAVPVIGQTFTVYASVSGAYKSNSVYVNLAAVPGAPGTPQPMTQNAQGQWTYTLSGGATKNGTYYGYVNATGSTGAGQSAVGAVTIIISATGGSTSGPFSVGVVLIPSPANGNTTESVQAVVTYTGSLSTTSLNVTFSAITRPYTAVNKWVSWAPSGVTISGGTSVTVVAKSTWLIPNPFTHPSVAAGTTFVVYANATVSSTVVSGNLTFTPPYINTGSTKVTLIGASVEVNGSAFQPNTPVALSVGGVAQTILSSPACSPGTASGTGSNVTTSSSGAFSCWFKLAAGTPMLAANVLATDLTTGQNATASLTPTDWSIHVSPSAGGLMNSTVTIRGVGFVSGTVVTLSFNGYSVALASSCTTGTPSGSTVTVAANGSFVACTFPVPNSASPGSNTITATDSAGQVATTTFSVTAWTLTVSPSWVSIKSSTTSVTVTGAGFAAGSKVSIVYNGSLLTSGTLSFTCTTGTLSGATITPSSGGFVCTLTLTRDPPGIYTFTATDYPSGQVAAASVGRS